MSEALLLLLAPSEAQELAEDRRDARQRQRRPPPPACATFDGGIDMCGYQSHRSLLRRLRRLEERFPGLARVGSIGSSVEGRDLAFIKLSSNVT